MAGSRRTGGDQRIGFQSQSRIGRCYRRMAGFMRPRLIVADRLFHSYRFKPELIEARYD